MCSTYARFRDKKKTQKSEREGKPVCITNVTAAAAHFDVRPDAICVFPCCLYRPICLRSVIDSQCPL